MNEIFVTYSAAHGSGSFLNFSIKLIARQDWHI